MFPADGGGGGWNSSPAPPPKVSNPDLQKILNDIYARPGTKGQVWESGTVYDALLREKAYGEPTRNKWHAENAAKLFRRLSDLLRKDAQSGGKLLTPANRQTALDALNNLGNALDAPDDAGAVTRKLNENPQTKYDYEKNIEIAKQNLRAIATQEAGPAEGSVRPPEQEQPPPEEPPDGEVGGGGDILGPLSVLLMIIDAERNGGLFSQGGCRVFGIPASSCPYTPQGSI
jgi:hypothetical protein